MEWFDKEFSALTLTELAEVYRLRAVVFNGEQGCTFPDPDLKDRVCHHVFALDAEQVVAYARYFIGDQGLTFGRVVVAKEYQQKGLGKQLMDHIFDGIKQNFHNRPITIHAQVQVEAFYAQFNFQSVGEHFIEAEREHVTMVHPGIEGVG